LPRKLDPILATANLAENSGYGMEMNPLSGVDPAGQHHSSAVPTRSASRIFIVTYFRIDCKTPFNAAKQLSNLIKAIE
jgi:hypothetical protein